MAALDDELLDLIAEEALIERGKLTREATLEDVGLDSVGVVSVVFAAEEKYGVEIPDETFEGVKTVGDVLDRVEAIIARKA